MNRKNVAMSGVVICFLYFVFTVMFISTGSRNWLVAFEIITVISGIFMLTLIVVMPYRQEANVSNYKIMAIVFVTACMLLTSIAHVVNITVTEHLMRSGVSVPEYLQIGMWPSVETVIDYLGWGLFMGLSFIFASIGIVIKENTKKLKITLFISGVLCIIGFLGTILINENIWYIAPMGYGIGTLFICIELLIIDRQSALNNKKL